MPSTGDRAEAAPEGSADDNESGLNSPESNTPAEGDARADRASPPAGQTPPGKLPVTKVEITPTPKPRGSVTVQVSGEVATSVAAPEQLAAAARLAALPESPPVAGEESAAPAEAEAEPEAPGEVAAGETPTTEELEPAAPPKEAVAPSEADRQEQGQDLGEQARDKEKTEAPLTAPPSAPPPGREEKLQTKENQLQQVRDELDKKRGASPEPGSTTLPRAPASLEKAAPPPGADLGKKTPAQISQDKQGAVAGELAAKRGQKAKAPAPAKGAVEPGAAPASTSTAKAPLGERLKERVGKGVSGLKNRGQEALQQVNPLARARRLKEGATERINAAAAPAKRLANWRQVRQVGKAIKETEQKLKGINRDLNKIQKDYEAKKSELKRARRKLKIIKVLNWLLAETIVVTFILRVWSAPNIKRRIAELEPEVARLEKTVKEKTQAAKGYQRRLKDLRFQRLRLTQVFTPAGEEPEQGAA